MKKFTPIGEKIKALREQLERDATQKEFAHKVGVSERLLRNIENENATISATILNSLAQALGVHRRELVFALDAPQLVSGTEAAEEPLFGQIMSDWNVDRLIPRFDEDIAKATMDEAHLLAKANSSEVVEGVIQVALNSETEEYARELLEIMTSLSWSKRSTLDKVSAIEEIEIRKRIRRVLVLLKGNDVWVYETMIYRILPESYTLPPEGAPSKTERRLYVVFGPPGEYGEETVCVKVDNGQPILLKAWKTP